MSRQISILICSSVKHREKIGMASQSLSEAGLLPLFPDGATVKKDLNDSGYAAGMAHEHYAAMRKSDAVYFILPEGRIGTSVTLELGYAAALGKPIFFSEKTNDPALDHYPLAFIALEELAGIAHYLEILPAE